LEYSELFIFDGNKVFPIKEGMRTAIAVGNMDNDNYLDLIVGNYAGGLAFYKGVTPPDKSLTVAITDVVQEKSSLQIFPNPTREKLHVKSYELEVERIDIYDVMGRFLQSKIVNLQSQIMLDVSEFPAGFYIIKVVLKDGTPLVNKFVKN
jgi:hypothetical protein